MLNNKSRRYVIRYFSIDGWYSIPTSYRHLQATRNRAERLISNIFVSSVEILIDGRRAWSY